MFVNVLLSIKKIEKAETNVIGKRYFRDYVSQSFLLFQPTFSTFTMPASIKITIVKWESKWLLNEKIKPSITANNSLFPKLSWMNNSKVTVEFKRSCLKQDKVTFTTTNVVNLSTVYELDAYSKELSIDFTLKDCLFGTIKLTKNTDPDKYSYSGYGIEFDPCSLFSLQNFDWVKNAIIFGVGNSSSVHIDTKKKRCLSSW